MSGGGKSKEVVVGYKYKLGVHLGLCQGPLDSIGEIIIGERSAWTGNVTDNETININKPELFGGDKREGGVVGDVDIMFGGANQDRNSYLQTFQSAVSPAYRGIVTAVFKSFQWSSGNPYFKPPWFRVSRIFSGWGGTSNNVENVYSQHVMYPWNVPTDANDGTFDPRNCLNDHEYRFSHPDVPTATWGTLENAMAEATAHHGFVDPAYEYVGFATGLTGNTNGWGSLVDPGIQETLELRYIIVPVDVYAPEYEWVPSSTNYCSDMYGLTQEYGVPHNTAFFWAGKLSQAPLNKGSFGIYYLSLTDTADVPPAGFDWYVLNNCNFSEASGIPDYTVLGTYSVRITVRRVLREPDDPCAPHCTAPYPDYPDDSTYCLIGSTAVKKGGWTPAVGTFKVLQVALTASSNVRLPLSPVLTPSDPNYSDEAYWTAAYNAAVAAGTIAAGYTYSSTGLGSSTTYPRVTTTNVYSRTNDEIADNTAWEADYAAIDLDMNPAHIIYQCLTDQQWGMGYTSADINETNFAAVAQTLYDEEFGLSILWTQQQPIETFIQTILDHINGSLRLNMTTGKFELQLIRDDYNVEDLIELSPSNSQLKSFERGGYGDAGNEVTVVYTDRNENPKPVTVHNLAAIQAQGGVVTVTRQYPAIREASLAARVAERDLATLSSNLAKVALVTSRILWDKEKGDVVAFTWPDLDITSLPMRIVRIDKGNLQEGKIEVELVEDVFGLPAESYTVSPDPVWTDTVDEPAAVEAAKAIEIPYWEIVRTVPEADMATFDSTYGFGSVVATRGSANNPINFSLAYAATSGGTYENVGTGHFCPTGTLTAEMSKVATTFTLTGFYDLDDVVLDDDNGYVIIDDECMAVVSVNTTTGAVVVRRSVLDSVPAVHLAGARAYFMVPATAFDPTERVSGETAYYKPLPVTGLGTLDDSAASALSLTFANRATRPYPPGKFRINTEAYPTSIVDAPLTVTWTHRDRLAQTVDLVDESEASIGPEAGTTYTMRLTNVDTSTVVQTITGISGTSQAFADTTLEANVKIELWSVRDGLTSVQVHEHTFSYANVDNRITEDGDNRITEDGDDRILE